MQDAAAINMARPELLTPLCPGCDLPGGAAEAFHEYWHPDCLTAFLEEWDDAEAARPSKTEISEAPKGCTCAMCLLLEDFT